MKNLIFLLGVLLLPFGLVAQAPQQIQYQAAARNASGEILKEQSIAVRLSLIDDNPNGTIVFQERHTVTTTALGLFQLPIGGGTLLSGNMGSVNWATGAKYLRVEVDPAGGSNYINMGVSPLLSVPYALHAASGGTTYQQGTGIQINGTTINNTGDLNPNDDLLVTTIFGGDLNGTFDNLVIGANTIGSTEIINQSIVGEDLNQMGAASGEVLKWNGSTWAPGTDLGGGGGAYNAGTGIEITGNTISALNENALWNALQLYGRNISSAVPGTGQVLKWDGMLWAPADDESGGGGGSYQAGSGISIVGNVISANANDAIWNGQRIQGRNIANVNPSNGQALVWNNSQSRWEPQTLSGSGLGGNGTPNYIAKFTGTSNLGNSILYSGSNGFALGTTDVQASMHIKALANQTHLRIDAHTSQMPSSPIVLINDANDSELLRIHSDSPRNLFLGRQAGAQNQVISQQSGEFNTFAGALSGSENVSGNNNAGFGYGSLSLNFSGSNNTAVGSNTLLDNEDGAFNTAIGAFSLRDNKSGGFNTAVGTNALLSTQTGSFNTTMGASALNGLDNGMGNTALGYRSMFSSFSGLRNVAVGQDALFLGNFGNYNVAIGTHALYYNNQRSNLVAVGDSALYSNSFGIVDPSQAVGNTGIGSKALMENTTGSNNTGVGFEALRGSTNGSRNSALGFRALHNNFSGEDNTALGYRAMAENNSGLYNTALGSQSLEVNSTGNYNTAVGMLTMSLNISGQDNTAVGNEALRSNISGEGNVAIGKYSLKSLAIGNYNTAIGTRTVEFGSNASGNTALGYNAGGDASNGSNNTFIGYESKAILANYSNSAALGAETVITGSNMVRLGNASVTSIGGWADWTNISDARVKDDIRTDVPGLTFINQLRPVSYQLDRAAGAQILGSNTATNANRESLRHTGFIAQEVDALVRREGFTFDGVDVPESNQGLYGIRYAAFVVPLVKAVQEQQAEIEQQAATISAMEKELQLLKEAIVEIKKEMQKGE